MLAEKPDAQLRGPPVILVVGLSLIVKYSFKTYCTSKPSWLDVNLSKYNEESIPQ